MNSCESQLCTTLSNGCLGFRIDEERGKMRYVMRIAEFSESSTLRTQMAQGLVLRLASWAQFVRGIQSHTYQNSIS